MQQHRPRGRIRSRDRARIHLRRRLRLPAIGEVEASIQDSDELAGGWLFAHLRQWPSEFEPKPIELELELLLNYAEACQRGAETDVRGAGYRPRFPCSSAWPKGSRDFSIIGYGPALSRTCVAPPASGHERARRVAPVRLCGFHPVGRAGQCRAKSPFYNGGALPALVLPLACLLPGSVEIDRGFSPPRNPGMPGLLLFWAAGHSPGSWLASALASPPPPSK